MYNREILPVPIEFGISLGDYDQVRTLGKSHAIDLPCGDLSSDAVNVDVRRTSLSRCWLYGWFRRGQVLVGGTSLDRLLVLDCDNVIHECT